MVSLPTTLGIAVYSRTRFCPGRRSPTFQISGLSPETAGLLFWKIISRSGGRVSSTRTLRAVARPVLLTSTLKVTNS